MSSDSHTNVGQNVDVDQDAFAEKLSHHGGVRWDRYWFWSIFTTIAGADSALLFSKEWKRPYNSRWDVPYFVGSGVAILATGVLAAFSSSIYAAYLFNDGEDPASFWPIGVVVGLIVVSLDRWLVSDWDVGVDYSKGRHRVSVFVSTLLKELIKLAPRLALTLVMAILFAEPLLLQMYSKSIEAQMKHDFDLKVASSAITYITDARDEYERARDDRQELRSERDAVNPSLRASIADQREVIEREQIDGNGNPRGGSCGDVCGGMLQVLRGYEAQLERERIEWDETHSVEVANLDSQIETLASVVSLSNNQAVTLGAIACSYPGTAVPTYPPELEPGMRISLPCPPVVESAVERKIAFDKLQDPAQSYFVDNLNLSSRELEDAVAGIVFTIALLRSFLILVDILPVMMKFVRSILPKNGYYLLVAAAQAKVHGEAESERAYARQTEVAAVEASAQAAIIERELREMEYERLLKTVHESRLRLGLRRVEDFVQDVLRRARRVEVGRGDNEPPIFQRGDLVPPPVHSTGPKAPAADRGTATLTVDDPRGLDD